MIIPVILCGGSGTRLWPLSRTHMPKQLQTLHGQSTMLQTTALRLEKFSAADVQPPMVICNDVHRFVTRRQLAEIGLNNATLIAEPAGRNSAPALTLAALQAVSAHKNADPTLLVMSADHVIEDIKAFHAAVVIAAKVAADTAAGADAIVTFGIVPISPATEYGYLRIGASSAFDASAFELEKFVEKPPLAQAQAYVASRQYLWNSGLFVVRASVWLKAMKALAPDMLAACQAALAAARTANGDILPDKALFEACPADSIDYAVMEKLALNPQLNIRGTVVPLEAGWSDVGAWDSSWAIAEKDSSGNAAIGEVIFEDARDNFVRTSGPNAPMVAVIGLRDVVVVHTPDAILVAHKTRAQDVGKIAKKLSADKDSRADLHRKVYRPWGWYDSLGSGPKGTGFQVKNIGVYPGQSLSLQYHHKRAEHWVVIKGVATITVGESTREYQPGEHVFIPIGDVHRLENKTDHEVEIIEVQLGSYLGEDDIVRLQDIYQRT